MTSRFDKTEEPAEIYQHLDDANQAMTAEVRQDIANIRQAALRQMHNHVPEEQSGHRWADWLGFNGHTSFKLAMPVAVAVAMLVLVSYTSQEAIPVLPVDLAYEEVPTEDLALLEDLEFASWLAEQASEVGS